MASLLQTNSDLRKIVDKLNLPTLPQIVARVNAMVNDPNVGLAEIGRVVASDAVLTAKILRLANSAYYGLREPVLSPEQAAAVVGGRALKSLVLMASVMSQYERLAACTDFDIQGMWKHAAATGHVARLLAKYCHRQTGIDPESSYTCGLIHDIGKVVLLDSLGKVYVSVFRDARRKGRAIQVSEKEMIGFTHTEVGALVATRWDFPERLVDSIRYHHGPQNAVHENPGVAMVVIADQIGYRVLSGGAETLDPRLPELAHKLLGIANDDFQIVLREAVELLPRIQI